MSRQLRRVAEALVAQQRLPDAIERRQRGRPWVRKAVRDHRFDQL